jgi:hypothetical protein
MRILVFFGLAPLLCGQITMRVADPHPFRQGEIIRAEIDVPSSMPMGTPPPAERWQFVGLLLDPPGECGTREKPCSLGAAGGRDYFGLMNGPRGASTKTSWPLNYYLPQLAPGRYRVAALARKLALTSTAGGSNTYGYADPPQYAVSDTVTLEIVSSTADWVRQTIARSVATLRSSADYQAQREAAEQLSLIDDRAAWIASLDVLPKEETVLLAGLSGARPASAACELMQERVGAPAQSVSTGYLYRLIDICSRANLPPAPKIPATSPAPVIRGDISSTPPSAAAVAPVNPEMQAWSARQRAYTDGLMNTVTTALAASVADKQPAAKAEAFVTLFQYVQQRRVNRPPQPEPAWLPAVSRTFVRDFDSVELARKQYLLELFAGTSDSPEMAPAFERVLDGWKPGDSYEAAHSALRALNRVDPARARARILAELVKDKTWLDPASLDLLPAGAVPPMDDALIEALARAQRPGGWNVQLAMSAVARYATPKALPRLRAIYESQQDSCQPELMAYFVRVDPPFSERVFRSHPWDMHAMPPRCTVQYFQRTPPLAMNPALEQYLAAYLMHGDIYIKSTAVKALGRYGTPSALPPLWDAFRYFHDYWKGKGAELEQNGSGVALEVDLRNAIGRGRGWVVSETDERLIESLCMSHWCAGETANDLQAMKQPITVELQAQYFNRVAQYSGLESVAAVEAKLAQYPRGTRFVLYGPAESKEAVELRRFAEAKGLVVTVR